ncbi:MAG: HDOD domain-containing protein [Pseudomonadota bacterium]|nr:HDOD domain-containing protein [Pseudomonadota bacterium]
MPQGGRSRVEYLDASASPVFDDSLSLDALNEPVEASDAASSETAESRARQSHRFFCWLLGEPKPSNADASSLPLPAEAIARLLEKIDVVIASEPLRAALLPRAPHVVPQLMKTLRDESYSAADVASRISKDVVLTTEVIRSAASARKRPDDEGEIDLVWAVAAIGTQGLRRAIANVVLKPMFDARGSSLSARAGSRIWKDADRKARLCTALATQHGLDPLDGYLVGLLHDTGWTALLRAIDNCADISFSVGDLTHPDVVALLLRRRDALFGAIVEPWNLSAAINGVAEELGRAGIDAAQSPLGIALRQADQRAAREALKD